MLQLSISISCKSSSHEKNPNFWRRRNVYYREPLAAEQSKHLYVGWLIKPLYFCSSKMVRMRSDLPELSRAASLGIREFTLFHTWVLVASIFILVAVTSSDNMIQATSPKTECPVERPGASWTGFYMPVSPAKTHVSTDILGLQCVSLSWAVLDLQGCPFIHLRNYLLQFLTGYFCWL